MLGHFVTELTGERSVILFASKTDHATKIQHYDYLPKGQERKALTRWKLDQRDNREKDHQKLFEEERNLQAKWDPTCLYDETYTPDPTD